MPTNVTADKIIGHKIYAKGNVTKLSLANRPIGEFVNGQLIGEVFSYIERPEGIYWMIDFPNSFLVKHETGKINCPDLPEIIKAIEKKKEQDEINEVGPVAYYLKKYVPWVIGAVAISLIIRAYKK